jgi:uncharacterized cupredoxin-like copper-binding protein
MAGGLLLSACGADSADGNAAAAASDDGLVMSMGEFSYSPSEIAAEAEDAEDADHDEGEAEEGGHGRDGNTIMVEPGGQVELTLTLPADAEGVWEMGCFIEGHYEAGMLGQLVVA